MDNFREWLSDNLRYFMLAGGILILLLLIFFGIRAVSGIVNGGNEEKKQTEDVSNKDDDVTEETPTPTETPADPLEKNTYPKVNALIQKYYEALGKKDVNTLKTLVDSLNPTEESMIENSQYIEGYSDVEVYTKKGMAEDTYVVFAKYNYICTGVTTPVPALSQLYVIKDGSDYKISQEAESNAEIQQYVSDILQDDEVQELISSTEKEYQQAQENDPELKEFLENLGKEESSSEAAVENTSGESDNAVMVTANTGCYVRNIPGSSENGESEVIGSLEVGEQVPKTGEDGLWVQVDYYGQTGYVFGEYVN